MRSPDGAGGGGDRDGEDGASDRPSPEWCRGVLNAYLSERHEPCPRCGYDLFGQQWAEGERPRCPECGHELRPQVWLGGIRNRTIRIGGRGRTPALRRVESVLLVTVLVALILLVTWVGGMVMGFF